MTFAEFDQVGLADWLVGSRANYVAERIAAGESRQEAEKNAGSAFERLVPGGSPAPGQLIGRVLCWDIVISDGQRGRGYGRQAVLSQRSSPGHAARRRSG